MDPYIGQIMLFGGNFAIKGWAFCNGQLMAIASNTALFSILGTTYGGDGRTTFGLPNLQGRVPIGMGNSNYGQSFDLGETAGTPTVTLLASNLPPHVHPATATVSITVGESGPNTDDPAGGFLTTQSNSFYSTVGSPGSQLGGTTASVQVGPNQGGAPLGIMPPYIAMNYQIALFGIFPPRN
jgi:microcystin-dependent protein